MKYDFPEIDISIFYCLNIKYNAETHRMKKYFLSVE